MMRPEPDPTRAPSPEQLAAYLDGELDDAAHAEVAAWLRLHPQALAEVEGQRRLAEVWSAASPPEPSEAEWARVLGRVETALAAQAARKTAQPRRVRWLWTAVGSLAAAVLLALGLTMYQFRPARPHQTDLDTGELFEVVAAGDVEIISMEDADSSALVVGVPPVSGPMVVASAGDILLQQGDHNMATISGAEDDPSAPMILAPRGTMPDPE